MIYCVVSRRGSNVYGDVVLFARMCATRVYKIARSDDNATGDNAIAKFILSVNVNARQVKVEPVESSSPRKPSTSRPASGDKRGAAAALGYWG